MTLPKECCEKTNVSRIKVEEYGRKAVILNEQRAEHIKIKVDGCAIKGSESKSADWIISRGGFGDVIIELKGKDTEHAAKQIHATASYWQSNNYRIGKIAALIVSTQYPKANTAMRKAQEEFRKTYQGPLHVVTKNYEGKLEHLFSSNGPHKL